ncbi:bem46 protein, variant [Cyanidiococcus yangmingshanensis]|uniref:Bem46 protein, variant n=1 Tax=Cyanidiococcus yangmingshanensis TaxID=2690220 RepID=A0A7J7IPD4_9RHOD|nr:bem46 protein, variant [Cyanidiococcus yangmingshanensis]
MIAALMDVVHEAIPRVAFATGAHTFAVSMFAQSFALDRRGAAVYSCRTRAGRGAWSQRTARQQARLMRKTKPSRSGHFLLRSCEGKVDAGASPDDSDRRDIAEAPFADQVLQMATTPGVADTRKPASGLTTRRRRRRTEAGSFKTTDRLIVGGALALGLSFIISTGMLVSRPRRIATLPQPIAHESRIEKSVPVDERHRWVRNSAILALATVAGMVVPLMFLLSIQNRLIYKPTRNIRGKPDNYGMIHYEDVYFCTADGHEIHGWFIKCSPEEYSRRPTFIYFHGADLNISYRLPKVFHIHSKVNCNVFLWSYRGYGMSEGFPSERGLQRDAAAMLQYLQTRRDIDQNQWWVFGESLGGAVALDFVYRFPDKIRGLVLENTFTALIDMIDLVHPYLRSFKWLITQNRWLSREKIKQLKIPVLLLSGQRDGFIPPRMMQELYDRAGQSRLRRLIRFTEGTHNKTWILPGYTDAIRKFVSDVNDLFPMNSSADSEAADRKLDQASEPATPS